MGSVESPSKRDPRPTSIMTTGSNEGRVSEASYVGPAILGLATHGKPLVFCWLLRITVSLILLMRRFL